MHGSLHPSAPLASIPCRQLNVGDTRSNFVYGKGAGQCRPEPVAWSAYLALCGSKGICQSPALRTRPEVPTPPDWLYQPSIATPHEYLYVLDARCVQKQGVCLIRLVWTGSSLGVRTLACKPWPGRGVQPTPRSALHAHALPLPSTLTNSVFHVYASLLFGGSGRESTALSS